LPARSSRTLAADATSLIRARIVRGDLQLGEAISEVSLAADLGVSKTPVREALLRLSKDGLVEIHPQRGTFVFRMSADQVRAMTEMREVLELTALHFWRKKPGLLAETLGRIVRHMEVALGQGDVPAYRTLDGEFHQAIIDAGENQFLSAAYEPIASRAQALRNRLSEDPTLNERSVSEHRAFQHMIAENHLPQAERLLTGHIRATGSEYVALLRGSDAN
jgi:DNA-binding GntR family transcriptional regulator